MTEFQKLDAKVRNISLVVILAAAAMLVVWTISYALSPDHNLFFSLVIGIALFLAGLLLFTRIQFLIWAEKKGASGKENIVALATTFR